MKLIEKNSNNREFLRGVSKFCSRVSKYENQTSLLTSAFHTFGSDSYQRRKVTNTTQLKKRSGKKIKVQPEAVKRRRTANGGKNAIIKGMTKRKDPFNRTETSVKRPHSFANNIQQNEAVSKKAGRTMSSKTKFFNKKYKGSN